MENKGSCAFNGPSIHTLDTMSEHEFNQMMAEGLTQAKANHGVDLDDAFSELEI